MTLIELMLNAPLIGIQKRWPNKLHAVEMDGLPVKTWPKGLGRSVCGRPGVRVVARGETLLLWPPYVEGLGQMIRCSDCYTACKKKKPRTRYLREPSLADLQAEKP